MVSVAKRGSTSRNKLTGGLLVGAVASGMVVASLSTTAPANAWCVSIGGLPGFGTTGGNCSSSLFSFALGLDDLSIAHSDGIFSGAIAFGASAIAETAGTFTAAWAGGPGSIAITDGTFSWAVAQGTNVTAVAGRDASDLVNLAFNFGSAMALPDDDPDTQNGSSVVDASFGAFNIAVNLGGNANTQDGIPFDIEVLAGGNADENGAINTPGIGNAAINLLGNRNSVWAFGLLNAAIAVGNPFGFPDGSNSIVHVGDFIENDPATLSVGFNVQPPLITEQCEGICGNTVTVRNGLLSVAGAIGLSKKEVEQDYLGITIGTPFSLTTATAALAAPAQQSLAATTDAVSDTGGSTVKATAPKSSKLKSLGAAAKDANQQNVKSVSDRISKSSNKLSDAVSQIKAKRAAKSTTDSDGTDSK